MAEVAHEAGVPIVLGALTPTEVAQALDLGTAAVKIFPAKAFGPGYFKDLRGPYPGLPLVASGGVNAGNAADFLAQGALAVCAGTDVVPPDVVAAGDWAEITRARASVHRRPAPSCVIAAIGRSPLTPQFAPFATVRHLGTVPSVSTPEEVVDQIAALFADEGGDSCSALGHPERSQAELTLHLSPPQVKRQLRLTSK